MTIVGCTGQLICFVWLVIICDWHDSIAKNGLKFYFWGKGALGKGQTGRRRVYPCWLLQRHKPLHLNEVLDNLLNPAKAIDEWETIDWCKWLMAGGRTPDEFSSTGLTFTLSMALHSFHQHLWQPDKNDSSPNLFVCQLYLNMQYLENKTIRENTDSTLVYS